MKKYKIILSLIIFLTIEILIISFTKKDNNMEIAISIENIHDLFITASHEVLKNEFNKEELLVLLLKNNNELIELLKALEKPSKYKLIGGIIFSLIVKSLLTKSLIFTYPDTLEDLYNIFNQYKLDLLFYKTKEDILILNTLDFMFLNDDLPLEIIMLFLRVCTDNNYNLLWDYLILLT